MDTAIITTIITAATTLLVSMGTWHLSAKQARKKETEEMTKVIESYRDELRGKMDALTKELSNVGQNVREVDLTVQNKITVIDVRIDNLTEQVKKHNEVIDRTNTLERATAVQTETLDDIQRRLTRLEEKVQ